MAGNIVEWLNSPLDVFTLIGAVAGWFVLWHLIIKRMLRKCKVTSCWYEMYELGALGTLGIVIFLLLIVILFIASMQAVIAYGIKLLFPLFLFWGGFIAIVILIIRSICKKK